MGKDTNTEKVKGLKNRDEKAGHSMTLVSKSR